MQSLAFKMLFRKRGTASAIVTIALLVALVTAVNCLVNNINAQTNVIGQLANQGETFLITSKDASSLSDSHIDQTIINKVKNNSAISYATSQQITQATLTTSRGDFTVTLRGVDNVRAFLQNSKLRVDGLVSKENEANVGIILSKLASLGKNDVLNLTFNGELTQIKVVGITQTNEQSDTEITMPLSTLQAITGNSNTVSFVEFSLKDPSQAHKVLGNLTETLPPNVKVTGIRQVATFAQDINNQTVVFINAWSLTIYVVMVAASYVVASRLVNESEYEFSLLKALGAKRKITFTMILIYVLLVALVGCIVGLSLGIVGSQTAASLVRWVWGNTFLAPFLEVNQAAQILSLAFAASFIGCIYPAYKGTQRIGGENPP